MSTGTAQEDYSGVSEMEILLQKFSQIFGDSSFAGEIVRQFTPLLEQYLGASARFGGGNTNPYAFGSQGVFAPTNVGAEFFVQAQRDTIKSSYSEAAEELNKAKAKFAEQAQQYMFGGDPAAGATAFEFLTNAGFARLQTDELLAGIGSGNRFMNVMAGFGGVDNDRLGIVKNMSAAVAADFTSNISQYGGLRGQDVGIVYSELARTGAFSEILSGGGFDDEITERYENNEFDMFDAGGRLVPAARRQTVEMVQKASQSIAEFRSIFQGSVTQVMDSVNSLLSTDVVATFEDAGRGLASRLSTTGFVTSTSPAQLQAAMASSADMSQRAGLGSLNSASAAMLFAEQEAIGRVTGSNKLIDPTAYRQTLLKQTTGAMYSSFARDIAGVYAINAETGEKLSEAIAAGGISSLADIAATTGLSASDIRAAGFSQEADILRSEKGIGGLAAMQVGIDNLERSRRDYLTSVYGADAVAEIEGPLTIANITSELGLKAADQGNLRRAFGIQARAMGFQGAEALDKYAASVRNSAELDRIRTSIQSQQKFKDALSGKGKAFGLGSLVEMAQTGGLADNPENLYRLLTGNADIETGEFDKFFSGLGELAKGKDKLAASSASLAARALVTNQIAGNRLTEDQQAAARAIFSKNMSLDERQKAAREFAATVSAPGELSKSMVDALVLSKDGLGGVKIEDRKDARMYLALGAIGALDEGATGLADEATFRTTAAAYRKALEEGKGNEFKFDAGMSKDEFMKAYAQTVREKKSVYDATYEDDNTDWTAKLLTVLNMLASILGPMLKNPADAGTLKPGNP